MNRSLRAKWGQCRGVGQSVQAQRPASDLGGGGTAAAEPFTWGSGKLVPPMDLLAETESLLMALEQGGASYALAGGLALAVHGVVRATVDVDLLVPEEEIDRVTSIARGLGFAASTELAFASGLRLRRLVKFAGEESLVLDLLRVDATSAEAFASRQRSSLGSVEFAVVSRSGLEALKLAAGRDQDLADVRRLRELDG